MAGQIEDLPKIVGLPNILIHGYASVRRDLIWRTAILLVAGDKSGVSEKRFYQELIRIADDRFDAHLARLTEERK